MFPCAGCFICAFAWSFRLCISSPFRMPASLVVRFRSSYSSTSGEIIASSFSLFLKIALTLDALGSLIWHLAHSVSSGALIVAWVICAFAILTAWRSSLGILFISFPSMFSNLLCLIFLGSLNGSTPQTIACNLTISCPRWNSAAVARMLQFNRVPAAAL